MTEQLLIGTKEVATLLNVSMRTVGDWRRARVGPPFYKLGPGRNAEARYKKEEVLAWMESRRVSNDA